MKEIKLGLAILLVLATLQNASSHGEQPLSRISIHKATFALHELAYIQASPTVLGLRVSLPRFISFSILSSHD